MKNKSHILREIGFNKITLTNMNIIPSEIEKYCNKLGGDIYIEIDLDDDNVLFRCVKGKYEMFGSTAIFLSGTDINDILRLNNVMGENGAVPKILASDSRDKDAKIHDLIYSTLTKYILQMLNAAIGKLIFPGIMPLKKHEADYFRVLD